MRNRITLVLGLPALLLLSACGGSTSSDPVAPTPVKATRLEYLDPVPAADAWTLRRDPASTDTRLILNLHGPAKGKYRGIGFTLQADTAKVAFQPYVDAQGRRLGYLRDLGVFQDVTEMGDPAPVMLALAGVRDNRLMVGVFQRRDDEVFHTDLNPGTTAKDCSTQPVLQVTLALDPSLSAMTGSVPLSVIKAKAIGEHITTLTTRTLLPADVRVGTLTLR